MSPVAQAHGDGPTHYLPNAGSDWTSTEYQTSVQIDLPDYCYGESAPIDPSSIEIVDEAASGTVILDQQSGVATYTPNSNFVGTDFFWYTVSDIDGYTSYSTWFAVSVSPPPVFASNDVTSTNATTPVTIAVLSNDSTTGASIDPSSVEVITSPAYGEIVIDTQTGYATYTPDPTFTGTDYFEYVFDNSEGFTSNVASVTVTVTNQTPVILNFFAYATSYDVWVLEGQVADENPSGMSVTFGGIATGYSAVVQPDGSFSLGLLFDNDEEGLVTAQTVDGFGIQSSVVMDEIVRY